MKNIIKLLKQIDEGGIKDGFKAGHYDLEGCVIELLDQLYMSGCDDESCLQKDAIMTYLHTQGENMEKTFLFTVTLQGSGDTPEEAWADAVEAFIEDPGEPHVIEEVEDDDNENQKRVNC